MAKRKPTRLVPLAKHAETMSALHKALDGQSKGELVDALLEIAGEDRKVLRQLIARFDVDSGTDELVAATRQAIVDATDFDERDANYNFDYDSQAYEEVKRNLDRLIKAGQLPLAMELSLELMKAGSYQVEMSDEGEMTDDIEDCLNVVIAALKKSPLPEQQVVAWCTAMRKCDRVGFIAEKPLKALLESARGS